MSALRDRAHQLFAGTNREERGALWVDRVVVLLVVLDLVFFAVLAGHEHDDDRGYLQVVRSFDTAIVVVFAVEYCLRLWASASDPRYRAPHGSRLRYAITPLALIDLLAALPVVLLIPPMPAVFPEAFTNLRTLRLLRLLRVAKLARYSRSMQAFGQALSRIGDELIAVLFAVLIVAVTGASLGYSLEAAAQPEVFTDFGDALWWAIVTMTTVGYGDTVPITFGGRLVGTGLAITGLAMFAAPAGLLAGAYGEEMSRTRRRRERRRERERREREGKLIEHIVEEAVADALREEGLEGDVAERVRGAAGRAVSTCPTCGQRLPDRAAHGHDHAARDPEREDDR